MITQNNLFKGFGILVVPVILTTSIVALTQKETLAIPLEPILDRVGRRVVEGLLDVDSSEPALLPANQSFTDTQVETNSAPEYPEEIGSSPANTQEVTNSLPVSPAYSLPAHPQTYPPVYPAIPPQTYPPCHATYPSPNYPQTYPPVYPTIPPNSAPVSPVYSPAYPQSYPAYPSARPSPPVIINNF
jgi:hypothetical protein